MSVLKRPRTKTSKASDPSPTPSLSWLPVCAVLPDACHGFKHPLHIHVCLHTQPKSHLGSGEMTFSCNQCLSECLSQCVTPCCQQAAGSRGVVTTFDLTASRKLYFYQLLVAGSTDLLLVWEGFIIFFFFQIQSIIFFLSLWGLCVWQMHLHISMHHSSPFTYTCCHTYKKHNCIKATVSHSSHTSRKWFLYLEPEWEEQRWIFT